MPAVNRLIISIAFRISWKDCDGPLKDKLGLAVEITLNPVFQAARITEIGLNAENVG
jgi:hypothetical protein